MTLASLHRPLTLAAFLALLPFTSATQAAAPNPAPQRVQHAVLDGAEGSYDLEDGREMLSGDVRMRHRLGGASSVQSALTALVKQDVVMKDGASYVMTDSLYREWVARKTF